MKITKRQKKADLLRRRGHFLDYRIYHLDRRVMNCCYDKAVMYFKSMGRDDWDYIHEMLQSIPFFTSIMWDVNFNVEMLRIPRKELIKSRRWKRKWRKVIEGKKFKRKVLSLAHTAYQRQVKPYLQGNRIVVLKCDEEFRKEQEMYGWDWDFVKTRNNPRRTKDGWDFSKVYEDDSGR